MTRSIVPFLRSVKGSALLAAVFSRSLTAVPAWADPADGWRLKMARPRLEAVADREALVDACVGRPGVIVLLASGTVVVDLDRKNGVDAVSWFERRWGRLDVPRVGTPSGGLHLWFSVPPGVRFASSQSKLAPGFDVLGTRAGVPLPGSWSPRGGYELRGEFDVCPMPEALVDALASAPAAAPSRPAQATARTTPWGRATLMRFASEVRDAAYVDQALNRVAFMAGQRCADVARADLEVLTSAAAHSGMSWAEAERVAVRAFAAGSCYPRQRGGRR